MNLQTALRRASLTASCAWILASCTTTPGPSPIIPPERRPVPTTGMNFEGQCAQREEDGFQEQASLSVREGVVQALDWRVKVGRKGSCSFQLADFRQTRQSPHIELESRDRSGCKLMIYQERRRLTLGHNECRRQCSADISDEAWPIMFNPQTGGCAKLD